MQDLKLLADIMTDFWEFQKTWINTRDWSGLVQASNVLHEKYHNEYLDQLILVCADDIERRAGVNRTDRKEMLMKLVERLCRKDR
jgi:hypothetical protein